MLHPTCNWFNHTFVINQHQRFDRLYKKYVEPVLGPLVGGSSDVDSRRRKEMVLLALSDAGHRLHAGFIFTCRYEPLADGQYTIEDLVD